jgi:hypothetical protein
MCCGCFAVARNAIGWLLLLLLLLLYVLCGVDAGTHVLLYGAS